MRLNLSDHGFLKISGRDAKKFLQGQLTCDLNSLTSNKNSLSAHCNSQGRVISLFRIYEEDTTYFLFMPQTLIPIAHVALKKYALFYHVELSQEKIFLDVMESNHLTHLKNLNIRVGIPTIYPETSGKFLPHDINLIQLNAISFDKGCYTGQEIIARMHYRGKLKKHLYKAKIAANHYAKPGADIYCSQDKKETPCGSIIDVCIEQDKMMTLIVIEEQNAKNNFLFLNPKNPVFFTDITL